ncbi:MAG: rhomboid family intramembrane serine protease [Clostridia bacterium]|nr:rhomboid family intramembrane serine protease [Clostridia bacterium]
MPVFTISFCAVIIAVYILDTFFLIPKNVTVSRKEKLFTGHNKGCLNRALHLSEQKIRKGEVWRLVSSALLHVGTLHILTNTAAMLIVGFAVETQLGAMKTLLCYLGSAFVSGLFMAFIYKLQEGEGASTGIFGLIAVFVILSVRNGTVLFSGLPVALLIVLAVYTVIGFFGGKTTLCEHLSGFAGGALIGLILTCRG